MRKLILATIITLIGTQMSVAQENDFRVIAGERVGHITSDASEASLRAIYGESRVSSFEIHLGDGIYDPGLRIDFGNGSAAEIEWRDPANRSQVRRVDLIGPDWSTVDGIGLGVALTELERMNGGSFELAGFFWDGSGYVLSWNGGSLEETLSQDGRTPIYLQLQPDMDDISRLSADQRRQVTGEGAVSSAHPVMQALNPRVRAMRVHLR